MPARPNVPYRHPGCPEPIPYGKKYCDKHASLHTRDRANAAARGHGATWRKARKAYLQAHPLCVRCLQERQDMESTDLDHIVPHRSDRVLFWDKNNRQALCHSFHSRKTMREDPVPIYIIFDHPKQSILIYWKKIHFHIQAEKSMIK